MYNLAPQLLSALHEYISLWFAFLLIITNEILFSYYPNWNGDKNIDVSMWIPYIKNSSYKFTSSGKIFWSRWSKFFLTEALFFQCRMILGVYLTFNIVRPMKGNYLYLYPIFIKALFFQCHMILGVYVTLNNVPQRKETTCTCSQYL